MNASDQRQNDEDDDQNKRSEDPDFEDCPLSRLGRGSAATRCHRQMMRPRPIVMQVARVSSWAPPSGARLPGLSGR